MPDKLYVTVEIPKGSSNKYEWDDELGAIKLDRLLFSSVPSPSSGCATRTRRTRRSSIERARKRYGEGQGS